SSNIVAGTLDVGRQRRVGRIDAIFFQQLNVDLVGAAVAAEAKREAAVGPRFGPAPVEVATDGPVIGERADIVVGRLIDVEPLGVTSTYISGKRTPAIRQRRVTRDRSLQLI